MTAPDSDLDQRLRGLYSGPRLDVTPRPDAGAVVLGRVRQARRRRRAAQAGVTVLAAVVLGGVAVNDGLGGPSAHRAPAPPASRPSATAKAPAPTGDAADTAGELVMSGPAVGGLRLGMTRAAAEASGLLALPGEDDGECRRYEGKRGITRVTIGPGGVGSISVGPFIPTPEGVAVGDRYRDVRQAYPSAVPQNPDGTGDVRVPLPGSSTASYVFSFGASDSENPSPSMRVTDVSLEDSSRTCP